MPESIQVQLKKGVLEMCVLALLSRGDGYAYDIASRLADAIDMGEGTIYPLMRRMQNDGLVTTYLQESASGPPRKYYRLTPEGRTAFKTQRGEWNVFETAVAKILGETQ
jgi:PadR family transcriptional regulator PadR